MSTLLAEMLCVMKGEDGWSRTQATQYRSRDMVHPIGYRPHSTAPDLL